MEFLKLVAFVWTNAFTSAHRSGLMIPSIAWMGGITGRGLNEIPLIYTTRFCATIASIAKAALCHRFDCDDKNGLPRCPKGCATTGRWMSSLSRYESWLPES